MEPQIIIGDWEGRHNAGARVDELLKENSYRDLSTICIIPTRGVISARVVKN